ncbi:hypothetical protein L5515_012988 [Caenorhabditis briggsae]|uniref:Arrestin-like N-terminal domain-containing protein n=1 Tax=Caenorhabditis briggsae TaxID=6238 RepID=A0AAE9E9E3_CAEBR|nr:hypothetical protein L5515_012988 [Caenorhabditis briggsae]
MTECLIHYDRDVYHAGDSVTGVAILTITKDVRARNVKVICIAEKGFIPRKARGGTRVLPMFEDYIVPWKAENGFNKITVGEYRFPFNFQLPQNSHNSYYHRGDGYMQYYVNVKVNRPLRWDFAKRKLFRVVSPPTNSPSIFPSTTAQPPRYTSTASLHQPPSYSSVDGTPPPAYQA